ncbi:MAG: hypothetical protein IT260_22890 [Saprospiraceae bacterium]|nr:hypothetical protein [Saprospiraceae bacterium]
MKNVVSTTSFFTHLVLTLLLLLCAAGLQAQQAFLSVQGVLTKSDGTAVDDGTHILKFRLWKDASSTNPADKVHEEEIAVETTGGVYSVVLGEMTAFGPQATFSEPYFLGVVSGSTELTPRPRLTSAPYALALLGSTNTFPSTGQVKADALIVGGETNGNNFVAKGGAPAVNFAGKGYSFGTGGDPDGGLFSYSDDHVSLYANATEKIKVKSGLIDLFGNVNVSGTMSSASGFGYQSGGTTYGTGLFFDGTQNKASIYTTGSPRFHAWDDGKNYYRATNGHVFDVGNVTINNQLNVSGHSTLSAKVRTNDYFANGGYTFYYPASNFWDDDSGVFGGGDGVVQILSNNVRVAEFTSPQGYNNNTDQITSAVKFWGIQKGPNAPQVEWDVNTGELQVDNSSRRLKRNIQPMREDFSLILKVEPKLYNRIGYPDSLVEAGYIAEEFDSLGLHHLVHYYANGDVFGIDYSRVSLYLTEIVKVHQTEIEKMKAEIAALSAEKNALRTENASLRADNASLQHQQVSFDKQLDGLARRIQALETSATNR